MQQIYRIGLILGATWGWFVFAQPPMERSRVNPDDSTEAVRRLRLVDAYVEQNSWAEAVDLLQNTVEAYPTQVIALPDSQPPRYVSIRTYCHRRISQLPADALELYRQRVDSQAKSLLKNSVDGPDPQGSAGRDHYRLLVEKFFCSSVGDQAIDRLGDLAFREGDFEGASRWWLKLLPALEGEQASTDVRFPDSKIEPARVWTKWAIAKWFAGDVSAAKRGMGVLKEKYPESAGRLAGREGIYWKTLESLAGDTASPTAPSSPNQWSTFAGNFARNKIAPQEVRFSTIQHRWTMGTSAEEEEIEREVPEFNNPFPPFQQPVFKRDGQYIHPVTLGSKVFACNGRTLFWFDIDKNAPIYQANLDVNNERPAERWDQSGYQTLSLAGKYLFVRTGQTSAMIPNIHQMNGSKSRLFCFDHEAKRLLWWVDVSALELGQQVVFEGSPVVRGEELFIGVTRLDAMVTSYVVSMSVESGEVRWKRLVCESTSDLTRPVTPDQNLLTLSGESLFYCTNQGAIAAINIAAARVEWLAEYDVESSGAGRSPKPGINPCLQHRGRLFAVPSGASSLDCFDSSTGQRLWRTLLPAEHLLGIAHGLVFVTGDRVYAVDEESGRVVWYFPENQPKGVGRGMLAGSLVYWPTASEIHVLDQRTGHRTEAPISLIEGLRTKAGNLIPGEGFALIAQNRQIVVVRPHAWLTEQREKLVADHPDSAEAHLLLATAAAEDDVERASRHFQKSLELVSQLPADQGESLAIRTRDEWVRAICRKVKRELQSLTLKDASLDAATRTRLDDWLGIAFRESSRPAQRWDVYSLRHELWQGDPEPRIRIMLAHQMLDSPGALQATVDVAPGWTMDLADRVADQLHAEFEEFGAGPFEPWDEEFLAKRHPIESPLPQVIESARRFPLAKDRAEYLLAAAEKRGDATDDVRSLRAEAARSRRSEGPPGGLLAVVEQAGAGSTVADEPSVLGNNPVGLSEPSGGVVWTSPTTPWGTAAAEQRSPTAIRVVWTAPSSIEMGLPSRGDAVLIGRAGELALGELASGRVRWKQPGELAGAWMSPTSLLVSESASVVCRNPSDGKARWRWPATERSDGVEWGIDANSTDEGGGRPSARWRSVESEMNVVDAGSETVVWSSDGLLGLVDSSSGQSRWVRDFRRSQMKEWEEGRWERTILVTPDRIVCRKADQIVAVDRTGAIRWRRGILGEAGRADLVRRGEVVFTSLSRTELAALRLADGEILWRANVAWPSWGVPTWVQSNGRLAVIVDHYELRGLDPATGQTPFRVAFNQDPPKDLAGLWATSGEVFLSVSSFGLDCRSLIDGRLLWRSDLPAARKVHVSMGRVFVLVDPAEGPSIREIKITDGTIVSEAALPITGEVASTDWSDRGAIVRTAEQTVGVAW